MEPKTETGNTLTGAERARLRTLVESEGLDALARRLGVHRETLVRAVAGVGAAHRGTTALIRAGIAST